jgi:TP901 family phage tail tape measure protein
MAEPFQQDIILDADGRPLFNAFEYVQREIAKIQQSISEIGRASFKNVNEVGQVIQANTKQLQTALGQLRTLTGQGTDYQKQLQETKLFFQNSERERKASIERQTAAELEGARIVANNNRQLAAQDVESTKLKTAARLEATRADIRANAEAIRSERELADARASNVQKLRDYRAAARTESDPSQLRALQTLIALERERGTVLEANARRMEAANARLTSLNGRSGRLLAASEVQQNVAANGVDTARTSYLFEQQVAQNALRNATGREEIVVAQRNLDIANARVAAVERLAREEQKILNAEQALASKDVVGQAKAQVSLAQQYAREQISTLGVQEAITRQKTIQLAAEERLRMATAETRQEAQRSLDIENARLRALEKEGTVQAIEARRSPGGRIQTAALNTALYATVAGVGFGALNAVQSEISAVVQLEDEFQKLQAISNSTGGELQGLKGSIFGIGEQSRFAVNDLVKIAQTLAQAGVSAVDMDKVLRSVTTLATASGSSPDEAVQLVTSALGAFQLQASEAGRIADLMTSALNRTKLTVTQVGQAIQYVGATAYEQNISLETLLATIGAVAQGGVKSGSTIGTGFRQFLVDLQTPSEKLRFELDRLGITQDEVNVKTHGLAQVLQTLKDKGFGATQAYDGLETRAAAFYLVAKNNVDVMEQLQLSFALSGAAATANERAMNSLTAQWTRFKNILEEGFAKSLETPFIILQNLLEALSNRILEMRKIAQQLQDRQTANGTGVAAFVRDPLNYDLGGTATWLGEKALNITGNAIARAGGGGPNLDQFAASGLGSWIDSWGKSAESSADKTQKFADALKTAADEVDKHNSSIGELDVELNRLNLQQADLIHNTGRTNVETVNLTSKFEGLAGYLGTTTNGYLDLVKAMGLYRGEQERLLGNAYAGQAAKQGQQNNVNRTALQETIDQIKANPQLMQMLTPSERKGLLTPTDVSFPNLMRDAASHINTKNSELADLLRSAAIYSSSLTVGLRAERFSTQQGNLATAAATPYGQSVANAISTDQANLSRLQALPSGERNKVGASLIGTINGQIANAEHQLTTVTLQRNKDFLNQSISTLKGLLSQVASALKPSADEIKEAKRAAADAKRAETEANKRPLVRQADLDAQLNALGLSSRYRRGHDESAAARAEEDNLHARGLTTATADSSAHTRRGAVARDISVKGLSQQEIVLMVDTINARLRSSGIEATAKYETGRGRNQGTAPHVHVGSRPGARLRQDRSSSAIAEYDSSLADSEVSLDSRDLKAKQAEIAKATTQETFDIAVANAKAALAKLATDMKTAALKDLAAHGIGSNSPQGRAKLAQVDDAIQQSTDELQNKIADGILKTVEAQFKASQVAFDKAILASKRQADVLAAQLSGLDLYSSKQAGVPEYVRTLAQNRSAQAQENLMRSRQAALPGRIARNEDDLANAQASLAKSGLSPEKVAELQSRVDALTTSLEALRTEKASLDATFGASDLIPHTFQEGMSQAIAAWEQTAQAGKSFKQTLIDNMGGAIEQVQGGLTDMFTSIFNGSQSALSAFGTFAKGIMNYLAQIAAKFVATQVLNMVLKLVGAAANASGGGGFGSGDAGFQTMGGGDMSAFGSFLGGAAGSGSPIGPGRLGGGPSGLVTNGSPTSDSVWHKLAKGEWVVQKDAVDSVGNGFMADLNANGAKAVATMGQMPQINMVPKQEMAVYVVAPKQQPSLSKNDVLVAIQQDVLSGGETKKLIKFVSQGG